MTNILLCHYNVWQTSCNATIMYDKHPIPSRQTAGHVAQQLISFCLPAYQQGSSALQTHSSSWWQWDVHWCWPAGPLRRCHQTQTALKNTAQLLAPVSGLSFYRGHSSEEHDSSLLLLVSVQNCISSLSYGCFSNTSPQTSLFSCREPTILSFLCWHDWRRKPRAFRMPSV